MLTADSHRAGCMHNEVLDLESLRRLLSQFVLVAKGPAALDFWAFAVAHEPGAVPVYRQVVCCSCPTFSLHGTCEHVHAAWLHSGDISMERAELPKRRRKRQKPVRLPTVLRPAHKRFRATGSAASSSAPCRLDSALRHILQTLNLQAFTICFCENKCSRPVRLGCGSNEGMLSGHP